MKHYNDVRADEFLAMRRIRQPIFENALQRRFELCHEGIEDLRSYVCSRQFAPDNFENQINELVAIVTNEGIEKGDPMLGFDFQKYLEKKWRRT